MKAIYWEKIFTLYLIKDLYVEYIQAFYNSIVRESNLGKIVKRLRHLTKEVMQMANSTCRSLGNLIKSVLKGKIVASKCFYYLRWLNIQLIKLEEQSMNRKIISH